MDSLPRLKNPVKHLLMDLDGTLIHSGSALVHVDFVRKVLPKMKHHSGWRAAWRALRESKNILTKPSKTHTNHVRLVQLFEKHLQIPFIEAEKHLAAALIEVFPTLQSHFGEIKGAAQFVEWAKNNRYSLTLATNPVWLIELVHLRMRWGGIDPKYFHSVTTSDRMHATKPNLEYFRELLEQEKFEAKDCLFIGNERKMDLPATQVGIAAFLLRPDADQLTCITPPSDTSPGAWRGSYTHLQDFLESQKA